MRNMPRWSDLARSSRVMILMMAEAGTWTDWQARVTVAEAFIAHR